ncbi:MAG TPA: enoyl-CoA hydratase/isomerase family protein [Acidimicrobiales bacterium]|nr:enoyl-CoA hydratase/isomerase family protein [Acidimicrobiales bacterium]
MSSLLDRFTSLHPTLEDGLLELVFDGPQLNSVTEEMHADLAVVWPAIDADPDVRAVLVRGANGVFSAGGNFGMIDKAIDDHAYRTRVFKETRAIPHAMLECSKPIVSAVQGVAVGAGLVVAILSDVTVAARDARLMDGHTRLGLAAGDVGVIAWPLLCGMAKAKYHLLTCEPLSGEQAADIGLVTESVDAADVDERARHIARRLSTGAQDAIRFTKMALNHWYRMMGPAFDFSVAAEMYGLGGPDVREGVAAIREKREPQFRT